MDTIELLNLIKQHNIVYLTPKYEGEVRNSKLKLGEEEDELVVKYIDVNEDMKVIVHAVLNGIKKSLNSLQYLKNYVSLDSDYIGIRSVIVTAGSDLDAITKELMSMPEAIGYTAMYHNGDTTVQCYEYTKPVEVEDNVEEEQEPELEHVTDLIEELLETEPKEMSSEELMVELGMPARIAKKFIASGLSNEDVLNKDNWDSLFLTDKQVKTAEVKVSEYLDKKD